LANLRAIAATRCAEYLQILELSKVGMDKTIYLHTSELLLRVGVQNICIPQSRYAEYLYASE
jgi:hypothetical protein